MRQFEMVQYGRWVYPEDIPIRISELAGHFDKDDIYPKQAYSLHTEYSFGSRKFSGHHLKGLDTLINSNHYGIPQLWKSEEWAKEFAAFIFRMCENHSAPEVIKIHPPFCDYAEDFRSFIPIYKVFEYEILEKYPNTRIFIENRCGSNYKAAPFLFSGFISFFELCEEIEREKLNLRIAFDIPQLFTSETIGGGKLNRMADCLGRIKMLIR